MNSIKLSMKAQTPSRFGMPIDGSTSGITWHDDRLEAGFVAVAADIRDRHVAGVRASSRAPSRGPLPGDHRTVDTNSIGSLQAADPKPGIRGLSVFQLHQAIRSEGGGETNDHQRSRPN